MVRSVLLLSLLIAVAFAGKSKSATTTAADAEAFIRGAASSFLGAEIPAAAKCSTSFSKADLTTLTTALNDFKTFDPMAWSNAFSKISPIMKDVKACASSAGTDATEAKAFEAKLMKSFGANSFLTDAWDVLTKDHSTLWSEAFGSGGMIPSFEAKNFGAAGTKFGDIVVTIVNTNTALVQTTDDHWSEVEPLSEADTSTSAPAIHAVPLKLNGMANECNPAKTCNVCSKCCQAYIPDVQSCDACVKKACPAPPPPPQCNPAKTCNVCSECCQTYIPDGQSCDACAKKCLKEEALYVVYYDVTAGDTYPSKEYAQGDDCIPKCDADASCKGLEMLSGKDTGGYGMSTKCYKISYDPFTEGGGYTSPVEKCTSGSGYSAGTPYPIPCTTSVQTAKAYDSKWSAFMKKK